MCRDITSKAAMGGLIDDRIGDGGYNLHFIKGYPPLLSFFPFFFGSFSSFVLPALDFATFLVNLP